MYRKNLIIYSLIFFSTIINCSCSSSEETKKGNLPPDSLKVSGSIPPGTADVKAKVLKFSGSKPDFICKMQIQEVFHYGASVSPLPQDTEIDAYVNHDLLEKESIKIKAGDLIFARISQTKAPGDREYWSIIMFNKNK